MGHEVFYDISCCFVQEEILSFSQYIFSQFLLILVLVLFSSGKQNKECVKLLPMPYVLCSAIKTFVAVKTNFTVNPGLLFILETLIDPP